MKIFLPAIPILLLVLLNACGGNSNIPPASVAQTQTAAMWTVTSEATPTLDFVSSLIFYKLNMAIQASETSTKFNQLEHIIGASYQVTGVDFPREHNLPVFRVKTRCECAENAQCCGIARTFAVTVMAMDETQGDWKASIPPAVNVMEVWCYDHANLTGVLSIPWDAVKMFFNGDLNGFQLWAMVTPSPDP